jgi:hypothetical protein
VGEKFSDLGFTHFLGMSFSVVQNEAANPVAVDSLGSQAKMFSPDDITDLIEAFRLVRGGRGNYVLGHAPQFGNFSPGTQP